MNIYIDAENMEYTDFETIKQTYMEESHEILSIKIYGDWSREDMKNWNVLCKKYSIDQRQCINISNRETAGFPIVIDIMDDIYNDLITNMKILKKILIVSSDSDFMHIHNRIVRFNIDSEVYSPRDYHCNKYKEHTKLFNLNTPLTIYEYSHNTNFLYDDNTLLPTGRENHELEYNDYDFADQNVESCMKNVLTCFRWINKNKTPYKSVNVGDFNKTYELLSSINILENVTDFDNIYKYLFNTNKLISYYCCDSKTNKIKTTYFDELFYKYGLENLIVNETHMCYRYNNCENKKVLLKQFYNNMQFLKDKNILLETLVNKSELEYNLKNKVYCDFELKIERGNKQYVTYNN